MILICKKCGGRIEVNKDDKICECEYCGSTQTVPNLDEDKRLNLFNRANNLRLKSDFDNAIIAYQNILTEYPDDSEAHFGLFLSKYGIEYVKDPQTESLIPTCHRLTTKDVLKDEDYLAALKHADVVSKGYYQMEGKEISRILKEILALSQKEEPYDIFISYKETDELTGERSIDSLVASKLYDALVAKKYKVFFSRISLENRLGEAYEPIIYSALRSSKVMLCVGTNVENFNAVWVKNEWSRYLAFIENEPTKHLIPCYKDMDPYDLPKEFKHLQAQDLNKVGALEDLLRGIDKIFKGKKETVSASTKPVTDDKHFTNLYNRVLINLKAKEWDEALRTATNFIDEFPDYPHGFILKMCALNQIVDPNVLRYHHFMYRSNSLYAQALMVANKEDQERLKKLLAENDEHYINKMYEIIGISIKLKDTEKKELEEIVNNFKDSDLYQKAYDIYHKEPIYNDCIDYEGKDDHMYLEMLKSLGTYRNCDKRFKDVLDGYLEYYDIFMSHLDRHPLGEYENAIFALTEASRFNYKNGKALETKLKDYILEECRESISKEENLPATLDNLGFLNGYKDSEALLLKIDDIESYDSAKNSIKYKHFVKAIEDLLLMNSPYKDSEEILQNLRSDYLVELQKVIETGSATELQNALDIINGELFDTYPDIKNIRGGIANRSGNFYVQALVKEYKDLYKVESDGNSVHINYDGKRIASIEKELTKLVKAGKTNNLQAQMIVRSHETSFQNFIKELENTMVEVLRKHRKDSVEKKKAIKAQFLAVYKQIYPTRTHFEIPTFAGLKAGRTKFMLIIGAIFLVLGLTAASVGVSFLAYLIMLYVISGYKVVAIVAGVIVQIISGVFAISTMTIPISNIPDSIRKARYVEDNF